MRFILPAVILLFFNISHAQLYRFYNFSNSPTYYKYNYTVLTNNGPTVLCNSRIIYRRKSGFFLRCGKERIYPHQTLRISALNFQNKKVEMFSACNIWLHTVREGRINLLSTNTEDFVNWSTHYQKGGDTVIHTLTHKDSCYSTMSLMMQDNARAYKMIRNSLRLSKARRYNFYLGLSCLAFTVGTIILVPDLNRENVPLYAVTNTTLAVFVGSFFISTPILMRMPERRRYKALRLYNNWDEGNNF